MKQKITGIRSLSETPDQCRIFLNGAPFVVVSAALIEKFGLRVGLEIEGETLERLIAADAVMRAKEFALRLVREQKAESAETRAIGKPTPYTKSEIAHQLERNGFATEAIAVALEELIQAGYIRDRTYAENWVARRQKSNPRGKTVLKTELLNRGIDRETAEQVVATVETADEQESALRIAERRVKQYKRLPLPVAKRRLHGFLARRGFSTETVRYVMEQIF